MQAKTAVPATEQRLVFGGKQLEDSQSVMDCGVEVRSTLHLLLRLIGGSDGDIGAPAHSRGGGGDGGGGDGGGDGGDDGDGADDEEDPEVKKIKKLDPFTNAWQTTDSEVLLRSVINVALYPRAQLNSNWLGANIPQRRTLTKGELRGHLKSSGIPDEASLEYALKLISCE